MRHAPSVISGSFPAGLGPVDVRPSAEMDEDLFVALGLVHVQQQAPSDGATWVVGLVGSTLDETNAQVGRHSD